MQYRTAMTLAMEDAGGGGTLWIRWHSISTGQSTEGYRAGKPVIVLSNEGKVLHGRKEPTPWGSTSQRLKKLLECNQLPAKNEGRC